MALQRLRARHLLTEAAGWQQARWLEGDERLGSLAVGKQTNLLTLDDGLRQQAIWIAGRRIESSLLHSSGIATARGNEESLCI